MEAYAPDGGQPLRERLSVDGMDKAVTTHHRSVCRRFCSGGFHELFPPRYALTAFFYLFDPLLNSCGDRRGGKFSFHDARRL
jgi:hypothetical protein